MTTTPEQGTTQPESTFKLGEIRDGVDVILDIGGEDPLAKQMSDGLVALGTERGGLEREFLRERIAEVIDWLGTSIGQHPGLEEFIAEIDPELQVEFEVSGDSIRATFTHELNTSNVGILWDQLNLILEEQPRMTSEQRQTLAATIREGLQENGVVLDETNPTHAKLEALLKMLETGQLEVIEEETPEAEPTYEEKTLSRILLIQTLMEQRPPLSVIRRAQLLAQLAKIEDEVAENSELDERKSQLKDTLEGFKRDLRAVNAQEKEMSDQDLRALRRSMTTTQRELDQAEDIDRMIEAVRNHEHSKDPRVQHHLEAIQAQSEPEETDLQNVSTNLSMIDAASMDEITQRDHQRFGELLEHAKEFLAEQLRLHRRNVDRSQTQESGATELGDQNPTSDDIEMFQGLLEQVGNLKEKMAIWLHAQEERQREAERRIESIRSLMKSRFGAKIDS